MIVNKSMFPVQTGFSAITKMQAKMSELQMQLGTGKKASTLAEMGQGRNLSISLRARLATVEGYQNNIAKVDLRLDFMDKAITRLDALESEARNSATPGAYGSSNVNMTTVTTLSRARLDEVVTLLNTEVNGRYVFGGNATDAPPVASMSAILDGSAGKDGFRVIAGERKLADLGDGHGRVGVSTATDTVTLAEDGTHPFGFKLSTVATNSASITVTPPAGAPPSLDIQFTALPLDGQTVTVGLTLPDGSSESLTLTAVTGTPNAPGEFQIGADANATAANFGAALDAHLVSTASTKLAAASTFAAADNFFNGRGDPVQRVDGPPFATATALMNADPSDTVFWYSGEDTTGSPRQTVTAKVDDSTTLNYGVQANETGLVGLIRSVAAMTIETFPTGDTTSRGRFDAMASRQMSRLAESNNAQDGSIEVIGVELGMARSTAGATKERHNAYTHQLETLLNDNEEVSMEQVAMEILALKTRLEASYTTTATVSQLSLVNFLPR